MKKSGLNKSYQPSASTDIILVIIAAFLLSLCVFIGYHCCQRRWSVRKKKATQRKFGKRKNHHENGRLFDTASQISAEILDPEDQDTNTTSHPLLEEKPQKKNKNSAALSESPNINEQSPTPSFLIFIMSSLRRKDRDQAKGGESSGKSDCKAASSSKKESPDTKRIKKKQNGGNIDHKSRSESGNRSEVHKSSCKAETKNSPIVGHRQSNSKRSVSERIPTNVDPLGSAQLLGIFDTGGENRGKNKVYSKQAWQCKCSGVQCERCAPHKNDSDTAEDNETERNLAKTRQQLNTTKDTGHKHFKESKKVEHGIQISLDESPDASPIHHDSESGVPGERRTKTDVEKDHKKKICYPPGNVSRKSPEVSSLDVYVRDATEEDYSEREREEIEDEPIVTRKEALLEHYPDLAVTEERRSIGNEYNLMQYARDEWKSDTETAKAIREGYFQITVQLGLNKLRVIRGDNYCAIRAALFQVLVKKIPILSRMKDNIQGIPQELSLQGDGWINEWTFGSRLVVERHKVCDEISVCLQELASLVGLNAQMATEEGRASHLLSHFNFQPIETEIRLLEAVKFLMLFKAIELYRKMKNDEIVPTFILIMFARDSSQDPQHFMVKHLNTVGDTGGLEQVEMHLLGYTLGVTIKVVRPSHFGQSDFIAYYPDDMPDGTPSVTMVAEDDRHYNILS